MIGLIKVFIRLITGLVNGSNDAKCVSFCNQKCRNQPTFINLYPNKYSQKFHYYPLAVILDRCDGSCNNLNYLSKKECFRNKADDLNLTMFNPFSPGKLWKLSI